MSCPGRTVVVSGRKQLDHTPMTTTDSAVADTDEGDDATPGVATPLPGEVKLRYSPHCPVAALRDWAPHAWSTSASTATAIISRELAMRSYYSRRRRTVPSP